MDVLALLVVLILFGLVWWATMAIGGAFGLPAPILVIVQVVLVIVMVLVLLQILGLTSGPLIQLK